MLCVQLAFEAVESEVNQDLPINHFECV